MQIAQTDSKYEDLVRYLTMARETLKERYIDTELVYSLAQTNLGELETFITSPNVAEIQSVGDRCFDEGLFEAARLLFSNIGNNAKLASTLVHLSLFREAVEAAKKANSVRYVCGAVCCASFAADSARRVGRGDAAARPLRHGCVCLWVRRVQHVEGGERCVRGRRRVPPRAAVRSAHHRVA